MKRTIFRKSILLIFILITVFAYTSCRSGFAGKYGEYKPALWYVENLSGNKVWLFGSIHVGVPGMYPIPEAIWKPLSESKYLCVETDITKQENDMSDSLAAVDLLMYGDGSALREHISADDLQAISDATKKAGIPDVIDFGELPYKPIFVQLALEEYLQMQTSYNSDYGVDVNMIAWAKENGIPVKDIEDPSIVYQMLGNLPDDTQHYLMMDTVQYVMEEAVNYQNEIDELFTLWVNGTLFENEYNDHADYETAEDEMHYERYNEALLYTRNRNMTDKVEEYLAAGEVHFYVVGAAHYPGEKGIIRLLTERGYSVVRVEY